MHGKKERISPFFHSPSTISCRIFTLATFRLTARKFAALDSFMRKQVELQGTKPFAETTRDIARAVIVDGEASIEVQTRFEVTKQRVSWIVGRYCYYQMYLTTNPAEGDLAVFLWLKYGFEMPNNLVKPLETFLATARRSKDAKKIQSAIIIEALEIEKSKLE
ncbi:MAG: hypothetical protein CBARDMAM_0962 [uncultured Caballeronia sp.]|nr:MAG: hypothetical protein CBARDMAM_0962 [uncultured Caballeronia sp.]